MQTGSSPALHSEQMTMYVRSHDSSKLQTELEWCVTTMGGIPACGSLESVWVGGAPCIMLFTAG